MALAFQAVLGSKHPIPLNFPLFRSYCLKSIESDCRGIRNRSILLRNRLLAAHGDAAYLDEPLESLGNHVVSRNDSFGGFLSGVEFLSLASTAVVCVYVAVRCFLPSGGILEILGSKVLACQCVILVCGLTAGVVIRRRQWRRICGVGFSRAPVSGVNLLERIEKLEQDLRTCTTIIHGLSRRLEKLGIRFRVSRKTLRQPIAETAALVQKTSDATQALAAQEDILERELVEIQKVLLAMQEQQQKQLELILAIGKTGKLWGSSPVKGQDEKAVHLSGVTSMDKVASSEIEEMETVPFRKEGNNRP